ncbi:hypothetical protein F2P46_10730 [Massilia sp. CCM 8734]|nr:hypothetical protein [Massilia sp. CCM 8734]
MVAIAVIRAVGQRRQDRIDEPGVCRRAFEQAVHPVGAAALALTVEALVFEAGGQYQVFYAVHAVLAQVHHDGAAPVP